MSDIVGGEVIVANLFAAGQVEVSIVQVNNIREELRTRFPSIYIDATTHHLAAELPTWSHVFRWQDETIYRGSWSDPKTYIVGCINTEVLPKGLVVKIVKLVEDELPNLLESFNEVFTPAYVAQYFNWRIPVSIREDFLAIIKKHVQLD